MSRRNERLPGADDTHAEMMELFESVTKKDPDATPHQEQNVASEPAVESSAAHHEFTPEELRARGVNPDNYLTALRVLALNRDMSTSSLQNVTGFGYTEAAHVMDALEAAGIMSELTGSKPRELRIPLPELEAYITEFQSQLDEMPIIEPNTSSLGSSPLDSFSKPIDAADLDPFGTAPQPIHAVDTPVDHDPALVTPPSQENISSHEVAPSSLLEALERDLAKREERFGPLGQKFNAFMHKSPMAREYIGLGLSVLSAASNINAVIETTQGVVRTAQALLGVWNYSALGAKIAVDRKLRAETPALLDKTQELLDKVEEGAATQEEKEALKKQVGTLLGYYRQGIDPTLYDKAPAVESTEESKNKSAKEKMSEFMKSPTMKTVGKLAFYASPLVFAFLAPTIAPALMAVTTTASIVERAKRIIDIKKVGSVEPQGPSEFHQSSVGALIAHYEKVIGLTDLDETKQDELNAMVEALNKSADTTVDRIRQNKAVGATIGVVLSGLFFSQTAHAATGEHSNSADGGPASPDGGDDTSASGSSLPDSEPVSGNNNSTTPGLHPDVDQAPGGPAGDSSVESAPGGDTNTSGGDTTSEGGPANGDVEQAPGGPAQNTEKDIINGGRGGENPFLYLFNEPLKGFEAAELGTVYEAEDGKDWIILDLDNDGLKDRAEAFEVKSEGGKQFAMINWADIRGQNGTPDYLHDHRIKLEIPESGVLNLKDPSHEHFGQLVHTDGRYVTSINGNTIEYGNKDNGMIFNFARKADVVEAQMIHDADDIATGKAQWTETARKLGARIHDADWSHFVARSGTMASLDGDGIAEIQVQRVGSELVGNWHGFKVTFAPEEAPRTAAEIAQRLTTGGSALAEKLASTSFAYNHLELYPVSVSPGDAGIEKFIDTIRSHASKFPPDIMEAITSKLDNSDILEAEITNSLDPDGTINIDAFYNAIGIPKEVGTLYNVPDSAPSLDMTKALDKLTASASDSDLKQSPWITPIQLAAKTIRDLKSQISELRLLENFDGKDVISVKLNSGNIRQFILPQGTLTSAKL